MLPPAAAISYVPRIVGTDLAFADILENLAHFSNRPYGIGSFWFICVEFQLIFVIDRTSFAICATVLSLLL